MKMPLSDPEMGVEKDIALDTTSMHDEASASRDYQTDSHHSGAVGSSGDERSRNGSSNVRRLSLVHSYALPCIRLTLGFSFPFVRWYILC
jgi:hypothetical protein